MPQRFVQSRTKNPRKYLVRNFHRESAPNLTPSVMAIGVRHALLLMAMATSMGTLPSVYAGDAVVNSFANTAARKTYTVPAGPLGDALAGFAASAGVSVQLDAKLVEGRSTQGISGSYTVEGGFARLLSDSQLEVVERGSGTYVLRPVAATIAVKEITLSAVTVTARTQSDLMAPTRQVTTLTREELDSLRQGSDSVATLLSKVIPGMADSSHTITDFGQTLRGRSMLVLVDGIPLNTNRDSSRNLANINPADVEQIEVLRGSSAIYGSGAAGGIVSIRTRQPSGEARAETTFTGTTPLSKLGAAGLGGEVQHYISGGGEAIDYAISLGARRVGGSFDAHGDRIAPEPSQGDLFDSNIYNASAKLGLRIDADQRLQLSASHYDALQDTDFASDPSVGKLAAGSAAARPIEGLRLDEQNRIKNTLIGLDYQNRNVSGSTLAAQLYYRDFFTRFAPFDARAIAVRGANVDQVTQNSNVLGGRLTIKTPLGMEKKTQLTWGADVNQERTDMPLDVFDPAVYDASRGLNFSKTGTLTYMPPITTRSLGGFAQLQHRFSESWSAEAGARYDRSTARFNDFVPLSELRATNPGKVAGGTVNYGAWTYNTGVVFNPTKGQDLFASYSQGFELPDIGLQVRNAKKDFNIAGSDLQPVKTDTVELGWRGRFSNAMANLSVFQSQTDLGAVQSFNNGLTLTRTKERIQGVEGGVDYYSSDERWSTGGTFTWMKGRELPQGRGSYQDMTGYRIAPLKLTAYVGYTPTSRWSHRLQATSYAAKDYRLNGVSSFGRRDASGYTTFDLISQLQIDSKNKVVLGIENLFNRHYFPLYSQLLRNNNNTSRLPAAGAVLKLSYTHRW